MFDIPQNDWQPIFTSEKGRIILETIFQHYHFEKQLSREIFPPADEIFKAFGLCEFKKTRVVIMGQDPYHGINEANGLAFSVKEGVKTPPSLRNIFKELKNEYPQFDLNRSTDLSDWARQGVLLINAVLTVEKDKPASHKHYHWEGFTNYIISTLSKEKNNLIFILLGKFAQEKTSIIDSKKHIILCAVHPSPLSANKGFLGSNIFKDCNKNLETLHSEAIHWG